MLLIALLSCAKDVENADAAADSAESFDLGTAAITVTIDATAFDAALPVSLLRTDEGAEESRIVARGTTGAPIEVGVGDVEVQVGPYTFASASGLDYYPDSPDTTGDGLPIITASERRAVLPRTTLTVDQATEEVHAAFVGLVGEGTYKCMWRSYELDETKPLKMGEPIGASPEGLIGWISLEDGRTLVPDPASPLRNYGGTMQPEDTLIIEPTPSGRYLSNIALESAIGNEILPLEDVEGTGVKGQGLNNFEVYYVDYRATTLTYLYCWYDWTAFAESIYAAQ